MATNRVKGITIELGGDTTGLDKALSGVNKEINSTKKELKDVERMLKLDPKNTELLEQKQRLLGDAINQTSSKLAQLKMAEEQAQEQFAKGEISQQQYDALQREIIATDQELVQLTKDLDQMSPKIETLGEKFDKLGKSVSNMAEKTKGISIAAAGVAGGLVGIAVKSGQAADDINTLSKQTGVATDTIQKFQYASDLIDVSFETVSGSLKKLTSNMNKANEGNKSMQETFKTLGVSVTDSTGALRSNEDVFYEIIDALGQVENETERDALAMTVFGKSATDLNPLILGGADALKQLGDEAEKSGVILSQDALDGANKFNDALDSMKAQLGGSLMKMGGELAEKLVPAMEKLGEAVGKVAEFIAGLDGDTLAFILTLAGVVAAISPILSMISTIITLVQTLVPIVTALNVVLSANPIGLIVLAIGGLIAALVLLVKNFDKVKEVATKVFNSMWSVIKSIINKILGGIESMVNGYIKAINLMLKAVSKVASAIGGVLGFGPVDLTLSTVSLPRLAKGGSFSDGSAIVGEAGAELLSVENGRATVEPLSSSGSVGHTDITDLLNTYLPYLAEGKQIVLDSGALVGATAPAMNNALGQIAIRSGAR